MGKIELNGGIEKLSLAELHAFVMIMFSHHTLCIFSCANNLEWMNGILFHKDYFKVHIQFSKTNQEGQFSVLPNQIGPYKPQRLMCLYIEN